MSAHREPEYAGVYLITCKQTGGSYVGWSADLGRRLYQHRRAIINRTGSAAYLAAFPHLNGVDFNIIEKEERPRMPSWRASKKEDEAWRDAEREQDEKLRLRERYWIANLKPTVNAPCEERYCNSIEGIPEGLPPEMKLHGVNPADMVSSNGK